MEIVTKIAPLGLAIIMLGLGMSLTIKDFTRVVKVSKRFFSWFYLPDACSSNYCIRSY